jgi:antitoxin YefM
MEITTYSVFRQNLKLFFDSVTSSRSPLYITRQGKEDMVVISKSEFDGMKETLHLLSSPKNAARLLEAIAEYKAGGGLRKELLD